MKKSHVRSKCWLREIDTWENATEFLWHLSPNTGFYFVVANISCCLNMIINCLIVKACMLLYWMKCIAFFFLLKFTYIYKRNLKVSVWKKFGWQQVGILHDCTNMHQMVWIVQKFIIFIWNNLDVPILKFFISVTKLNALGSLISKLSVNCPIDKHFWKCQIVPAHPWNLC